MSILPLPDPEAPQELSDVIVDPQETIHLTTLEAYAGQPGGLTGVSFWPRAAARVIDTVIHYVIAACCGFVFALILAITAYLQHNSRALLLARRPGGGLLLLLFGLLGTVALETVCEGFHGSTLGKLLLGLVVVQEDGTPCRPGSALIRSLAYFIDAIFFGAVAYFAMQKTPQQQRHGDDWAHTIVYRRSQVEPQVLRGGGQFAMVFSLAAMADATLIISALLIKVLN